MNQARCLACCIAFAWTNCAASTLDANSWASMSWIGGFNQLRAEFDFPVEPPSLKIQNNATLRITALGCYEVYLNGERLGNSLLDPGFSTVYSYRLLYREYSLAPDMLRYPDILLADWFQGTGYIVGRLASGYLIYCWSTGFSAEHPADRFPVASLRGWAPSSVSPHLSLRLHLCLPHHLL